MQGHGMCVTISLMQANSKVIDPAQVDELVYEPVTFTVEHLLQSQSEQQLPVITW